MDFDQLTLTLDCFVMVLQKHIPINFHWDKNWISPWFCRLVRTTPILHASCSALKVKAEFTCCLKLYLPYLWKAEVRKHVNPDGIKSVSLTWAKTLGCLTFYHRNDIRCYLQRWYEMGCGGVNSGSYRNCL